MLSLALCLCLIATLIVPIYAASYTHQGTYNGVGYSTTSTGTSTYFKGYIGCLSSENLKVTVVYDFHNTDGDNLDWVANSVIQPTETKVELSLVNGYYINTLDYTYRIGGTIVHTYSITL